MSSTFGFKLGIEGEKEFKSKISAINQDMKVLGSELKLVSAQYDSQDKSIAAVTARNTALHRAVDGQKTKVQALKDALENASSAFGENDRRTKEWQIKLNNATAELVSMEKELKDSDAELKKLGDQAKATGKKFIDMKEDADDLQKGVDAASKGLCAAAAAIGAAIAATATAMTKMTVEAAAYADEVITVSTVTGMSTESIQAYSYAADLVDVSLNTLTGSMSKNIKSMASARDGSEKYASAYKQLGITVTDSNGKLRDSEEVYWEVIDALGKMDDETERDVLAMQLFGKSAQELNPLIAQGSEGIKKYTEEAKTMGAVLSDDTIDDLGAFDDSVQRMKQGMEAAKRSIGTILLPELQKLAKVAIEKLAAFSKALQDPQSETRKLIDDLKECANVVVNILFVALKALANVLVFLAKNIKIVVPVVGTLVTAFLILKAALAITATIEAVKVALAALPATATAAKTAMTGLSAAMSTNVIGACAAAAAAIGMLVAAIVGLCTAEDDEVAQTPEFVRAAGERAKAAREEREAIDELATSYWNKKDIQEKQATADLEQLDHAKKLAKELMGLADSSGKVKKADKERAQFILEQLNEALGTEYELTGNQIKNYKKLKKNIYDVIEAKKAQIILDAYEPIYTEAIQNRIEKEKEQARITKEIAEQKKKVAEAEKTFKEAYNSGKDSYDLANKYIAEKNALTELETAYQNNEDVLIDYYGTIDAYESASTQMLKGNTKKAIDILDTRNASFKNASDVMAKTSDEQKQILRDQYDVLAQRAEEMEARLKNGIKGVTQEMVDDAKAMAEKAAEEYEAVGGIIPERMAVGVDGTRSDFTNATRDAVRAGIAAGKQAATNTQGIGKDMVNGISEGVRQRKGAFSDSMREIIRAGINAAKVEAQIKSPSKKTRDEIGFQLGAGAALGIRDSTHRIRTAVIEQMRDVNNAYAENKPKLNFTDMFKGIETGISGLYHDNVHYSTQSSVVNIYPKELTPAQIDYIVDRVNRKLGCLV